MKTNLVVDAQRWSKVRATLLVALLLLTSSLMLRPVSASAVSLGPTISRSEILSRSQVWIDQKVTYSQTLFTWGPATGDIKYRQDCSGFVSMAWKLPANPDTEGLTAYATQLGSLDDLQPGDMIDKATGPHANQHVVLFVSWDAAKQTATIRQENKTGTPANQTTYSKSYLQSNGYVPYRYNNVSGNTTTSVTPGSPIATTHADGRTEVFVRMSDGSIRHDVETAVGKGFSASFANDFGKQLSSDPSVLKYPNGRLELFALDNNGTLAHKWETVANGAWAPTGASFANDLGGKATGIPAPAVNKDGRAEVFTVGTSGDLQHAYVKSDGKWQSLISMGGTGLTQSPAVIQNADGRLQVFVNKSDGSIQTIAQKTPGGAWGSLTTIARPSGINSTRIPAVAMRPDGRITLVERFSDNSVRASVQTATNAATFGSFTNVGFVNGAYAANSSVTVGVNKDGTLEIFARGGDNYLYNSRQDKANGKFLTFYKQTAPVGVSGRPYVSAIKDGRLQVFYAQNGVTVNRIWQDSISATSYSTVAPIVGKF